MENNAAFKWETTEYSYYSQPDYKEQSELGKQLLVIDYTNMNVDINHEVMMVDFNTFVSNVGGALGLFLGFSIIDTLHYFINTIFKLNK